MSELLNRTDEPDEPDEWDSTEPYDDIEIWLPGLSLSILVGIGSYCLILYWGEMGSALFFGVPSAMGALLGYRVRTGIIWMVLLSLASILSVVFGLLVLSMSGLFCGLILGVMYLGPFAIGLVLGVILRRCLKMTNWGQQSYLPTILLSLLPLGEAGLECLFDSPDELHSVSTNLTFHATATEAWESMMFYEEVNVEPPWLLKLALPRPVKAEGKMGQVGEVRRCLYENGHISKRITKRVERKELAFTVIEQKLHFEKDVTLKDGRFLLHQINEKETQVILTTRYVRHLRPAWLWKPIEEKVVHTLHQHVLEGMKRSTKKKASPPPRIYHPHPLNHTFASYR